MTLCGAAGKLKKATQKIKITILGEIYMPNTHLRRLTKDEAYPGIKIYNHNGGSLGRLISICGNVVTVQYNEIAERPAHFLIDDCYIRRKTK